MTKMIDADQLIEWLDKRYYSFDTKFSMFENIRYHIESGTFDPTPPVQPDIKPGDRVNVVKSVEWDFLQDVRVNSIVENHFGKFANLEFEGREYTIKIHKLEVIQPDTGEVITDEQR